MDYKDIYLDDAATTAVDARVLAAMMPYFEEKWYNPSSLYSPSERIRDDIENSASIIAKFLGCYSDEIYFTSGASESNSWAIEGFVNHWINLKKEVAIITTEIEHESILKCVNAYMKTQHVFFIDVDNKGFVNRTSLINVLQKCKEQGFKTIVSVQFANNEIGTIQSIGKISEIVHKYGAVLHTDATQAFGHIPINVCELGIDMMSASGHKIGTPKGIGFLYKKCDICIDPIIFGTQNSSMRGGTENVPYIIGLGEAVKIRLKLIEDKSYIKKQFEMRDRAIKKLQDSIGCKLNGSAVLRLPNNINITLKQNVTGEVLVYLLDLDNVYISTGSACNSRSIEVSHVLNAIGLSHEDALRTIRITFSDYMTEEKLNEGIDRIIKSVGNFSYGFLA